MVCKQLRYLNNLCNELGSCEQCVTVNWSTLMPAESDCKYRNDERKTKTDEKIKKWTFNKNKKKQMAIINEVTGNGYAIDMK